MTNFDGLKKLSKNSINYSELLNTDIRKDQPCTYEPKMFEIPSKVPVKAKTKPLDIVQRNTMFSSLKKSLAATNKNSHVEPSLTRPKLVVPLNNSNINVLAEEYNSMSEFMSTSFSAREALSSSNSLVDSSLFSLTDTVPSHTAVVSSPSKTSSNNYTCQNLPNFHRLSTKTVPKFLVSKNVKHLETNYEPGAKIFGNENRKQHSICNNSKTMSQSFNSECVDKISVVKHAHENGICLHGPKYTTSNIPRLQLADLVQKTSSIEQKTTNLQLDRRKKSLKLDDTLLTDTDGLPIVQVNAKQGSSNDSFIMGQTPNNTNSFVMETSASSNNLTNEETFQGMQNSTNEDTFEEIHNATSSNVDRGIKRKRTTS